jgi:hypothetical protein
MVAFSSTPGSQHMVTAHGEPSLGANHDSIVGRKCLKTIKIATHRANMGLRQQASEPGVFSASSSLSCLAPETFMPPNLLRHR